MDGSMFRANLAKSKPAFNEIKQYYKPGLCTRLLVHQKDEKKDAVK